MTITAVYRDRKKFARAASLISSKSLEGVACRVDMEKGVVKIGVGDMPKKRGRTTCISCGEEFPNWKSHKRCAATMLKKYIEEHGGELPAVTSELGELIYRTFRTTPYKLALKLAEGGV